MVNVKRNLSVLFFVVVFGVSALAVMGHPVQAKDSTEMQLKNANITVGVGKDYTKTIVVKQGNKKVLKSLFRFRTTNPKIAVVSQKGTVTGKKPGKVRIICTQKSTNKKYVCHVNVQRYVEAIEAGDGYLNFYQIGEKQQIETSIYPKKATIQQLSYKSSDPKVVTVNGKGVATCTGEGEATITVKAMDGQKSEMDLDVCLVSGFQEPFGISEKQDMPHGSLKTVTFPLNNVSAKSEAVVYTPPGYTTGNQYPVMYLLHGAGDNAVSWTQSGGANYIMDYLYSRNLAKEMIVVMPDNGADEVVLDCLQPYIAQHYSIATGPENTAIAGYSMGGMHAQDICLQHPERFSWLGMFSPASSYSVGEFFYNQLPAGEGPLFTYPLKGVWLSIGSGDQLVGTDTKNVKMYLEKDISQQYFADYGAWYYYYKKKTDTPHSWKEWRNGLYNFARLIFQ